MRKLILFLALIAPSLASAQSDYSAQWAISTPIGENKYTTLYLDINEGTRFLAVNGILFNGTNSTPATGTCFLTSSGDFGCSLSVSAATYSVTIFPSLNGTIRSIAIDGTTAETSGMVLREIL